MCETIPPLPSPTFPGKFLYYTPAPLNKNCSATTVSTLILETYYWELSKHVLMVIHELNNSNSNWALLKCRLKIIYKQTRFYDLLHWLRQRLKMGSDLLSSIFFSLSVSQTRIFISMRLLNCEPNAGYSTRDN